MEVLNIIKDRNIGLYIRKETYNEISFSRIWKVTYG